MQTAPICTAQAQIPDVIAAYVANCRDRYAFTAPVGSYRANGFGLHDMLGNAGEWTQDCWNGDYKGAPTDGSSWGSGECFMRAVRGGSWDDHPLGVRSAYRVGSPIVIRLYSRGFRVARGRLTLVGRSRVRLEYRNLVAAKYGEADNEIPTPIRAAPLPA